MAIMLMKRIKGKNIALVFLGTAFSLSACSPAVGSSEDAGSEDANGRTPVLGISVPTGFELGSREYRQIAYGETPAYFGLGIEPGSSPRAYLVNERDSAKYVALYPEADLVVFADNSIVATANETGEEDDILALYPISGLDPDAYLGLSLVDLVELLCPYLASLSS